MCRAASLVIPGSDGLTGPGRPAPLQHRAGPFVPVALATYSHRGKPLLWRRMRAHPPDFPRSSYSAAPVRLPWRSRGRERGEDPAGNPPPPPSRGAPLWFEPVSPDCMGAGAVEDSPSPQGLAATGACVREMLPHPPHGESPGEEQTTLRMRIEELPSLTLSRSRGFPLLVRRRGSGFQPMRLCYGTKAVAWSFRACLRNIYFDTVSLYMAQPRFELTAMLLPQTGESHHTWL